MKHKKKITETLRIDIDKQTSSHQYKPSITIGDIYNTDDVYPDDILLNYMYETRTYSEWGTGEEKEHHVPVVVVERTRMETDEEFDERIQREGKIEKQKREREYQEYLRLKGIFED